MQFKGKSLDTGRNIREHNLRSTGDDIVLREENVSRAYMVEITQRQFVERDPFNNCRDYPNPEYASYDECDNQFTKEKLPGLTPVWITKDPAEVTIQKEKDENGTYGKFPFDLSSARSSYSHNDQLGTRQHPDHFSVSHGSK